MKRFIAAVAFLFALCTSGAAFALTQRTFVASNGSDTWPCTRTQPCRSFATAIGKTADKGEVVVLDSAGYGPFTITQSVSVIAPAGVYAGVTVASGTGITINGVLIDVSLRGLSLNGQGGDYGIRFEQGRSLTIADCEVANVIQAGVVLTAPDSRTVVRNAVVRNNHSGIIAHQAAGFVEVSIADSTIANHVVGIEASADVAGGDTVVSVTRTVLTRNVTAMQVVAQTSSSASILSDGNTITHTGLVYFLDGVGSKFVYTPGNNTVGYYGTLVTGGTMTPCCAI